MNIFTLSGPAELDSVFYAFVQELAVANGWAFHDMSNKQLTGRDLLGLPLASCVEVSDVYGGLRYLGQDFFASTMTFYDLTILLLDFNSLVSLVEDSAALHGCSLVEAARLNKYYFLKYFDAVCLAATTLSDSSLIIPSSLLETNPAAAFNRIERFLCAKPTGIKRFISADFAKTMPSRIDSLRIHPETKVKDLLRIFATDPEMSMFMGSYMPRCLYESLK